MKNSSNIRDDEPRERIKIAEIVGFGMPDAPGVIRLYNINGTLLQVVHHASVRQRLTEIWMQRNSGPFAYAVSAAIELFENHRYAVTRAKYAIREFKPEDQTAHVAFAAGQ